MFRCPRCHQELPANARFCNNCGFNQTNARLDSIRAAQDALNESPLPSVPPVSPSIPQQPPVSGEHVPGLIRAVKVGSKQHAAQTLENRHAHTVPSSPAQQSLPPVPAAKPIPSRPRVPETPPPVLQPSNAHSPTGRYVSATEIASSRGQPLAWQFGLPDTLTTVKEPSNSPDSADNRSLFATNRAAEQWHKSWRDRQRAEAGPAVNVSRGQASVPEPLLAMQHSILRMRAIVLPKNQGRENNFGFWMIIVMMVCLFVGLISYIVWSYLPGAQFASQAVSTSSGSEPTLSFVSQDAKRSNFSAGQAMHVQGQSFGAHDQIIFLLETTTLNSSDGKPVTVTTDSHGSFTATLTIPTTQLAGEYVLQAQDNHTGQHAFLDIAVTAATTSTTSLSLSSQGNPISSLTFASIVGKKDPPAKDIDITNTSNAALSWTAAAVTNENTGWLVIENNQTGGQLNAQQSSSISIGVLTQGLKVTDKAHSYKGEVIFTIPHQGQVILPVELQIADAGVEVVITPNPIISAPSATAPGSCPNSSLTLINLNATLIDWTVKPADAFNAQHIHVDGRTSESSTLQPSGYAGDSKVIQLTCIGVQLGSTYTLTVYYNGQTETVPVNIRNS